MGAAFTIARDAAIIVIGTSRRECVALEPLVIVSRPQATRVPREAVGCQTRAVLTEAPGGVGGQSQSRERVIGRGAGSDGLAVGLNVRTVV